MVLKAFMGITLLAVGGVQAAAAEVSAPRVLIVVSGHGADAGKTRPGFEMDGLAQAYAVFADNGLAVDIASPVVVDGRLVTGQNPCSTPAAAEALVRAMGRTPVARQPWADERSIALVGRILAGEGGEARRLLAANPADFDVALIAMWGFCRAKAAGDDRAALARAVEVMEIAQPHFAEPRLAAAIIDNRNRLAGMH